jgi:hypothetical protein
VLAEVAMNLAEANHILRLTDAQLAIVRRSAASLRPAARDRYLRILADELAEAKRVDDATVQSTVETVLSMIVDR